MWVMCALVHNNSVGRRDSVDEDCGWRPWLGVLDFAGASAMHHAALWGRERIVESLLDTKTGASHVNLQDNAGNTPLHFACASGNETVQENGLCVFLPNIQLTR